MVIVLKFDALLGYLFSGSFEYRKQVFIRDSSSSSTVFFFLFFFFGLYLSVFLSS